MLQLLLIQKLLVITSISKWYASFFVNKKEGVRHFLINNYLELVILFYILILGQNLN